MIWYDDVLKVTRTLHVIASHFSSHCWWSSTSSCFNSSASITVWPPKWLHIERSLAECPGGHHSSLLSTIRALHGNSGQFLSTRHKLKLNETDKVLLFKFREPSGKEKTEPTDTSVASNCTDYHNYLTLVTLRSFKDGIIRNMRFWDPSFHEDNWGTQMQLLQKVQTRAWKQKQKINRSLWAESIF